MRSGFVVLVSLVSLGLALFARAGSVRDADLDLVPDAFDNCIVDANGPNQSPNNQIDGDLDGYGNWCDADFNNDGTQDGADIRIFVSKFNTTNGVVDLTGDGYVDGADFGRFVSRLFGSSNGPSGLPCAGTIPCLP